MIVFKLLLTAIVILFLIVIFSMIIESFAKSNELQCKMELLRDKIIGITIKITMFILIPFIMFIFFKFILALWGAV